MLQPPQKLRLPFIKKERLALDTYALYFDRRGVDFTFLPGQYVRLSLIPPFDDPRGNHRSFSISSSPLDKATLMIITHGTRGELQSPFKQKMLSLTKGEEVTFWGPMGIFVLPEKITGPICLLSGGVGIAPFLSIVRTVVEKKLPHKVTLIASFRTQEEVFFLEELTKHTLHNSHIEIVYTLTRHNKNTTNWQGEIERIAESLLKKYISSPEKTLFYICGSVAMVEGMTETLLSMRITPEQIHRELFTGY